MSPSQPPKQRAQAVLHPVLHLGYLPVTLLLTPIRQLAMYMCNHVKFSFCRSMRAAVGLRKRYEVEQVKKSKAVLEGDSLRLLLKVKVPKGFQVARLSPPAARRRCPGWRC